MDVLEHHDRRSPIGDPLEEDPAGREQVLLVADASFFESEQVPEPRPNESALVGVGDVLLDRLRELRGCRGRLLVLGDPRPPPDHLGERPERDTLAVGQAAPLVPPHIGDEPVDVFVQLPDQPGLPDPGDPLHGDHVDLPVIRGIVEQILDQSQLAIAACEGRLDRGHPPEPAESDDPLGPPEIDRGFLAFELERAGRLVGDHGIGRAHRGFADEDGAGRRDRLDPRGGVHEVAGDHALVLGSEVHGGLPRQNPGPRTQIGRADIGAHVLDQGGELEGGADGTLRVVLVRDRGAPQGHHGVADELLDDPAVAFHDPAALLEVAGQELPDLFRVTRFGKGREADEVREKDRDEPTFGRWRRGDRIRIAGRRGGSRFAEGRPAVSAEPLARWIRGTAGCTERGQRVPASTAEPLAGRVLVPALGAAHPHLLGRHDRRRVTPADVLPQRSGHHSLTR